MRELMGIHVGSMVEGKEEVFLCFDWEQHDEEGASHIKVRYGNRKFFTTGFKTKGIKSDLPNKEKSRINQNFIQLPISKFKNKIKELCSRYNIKYMEINESYTSICSFYDNEEIKYHKNYLGKRMTRSLFKTKEGKIINADINGALNILKKGKPDRTDIISFLRNIGQTVPIRQKIKL